jgi:hypothetical protein
MALNNISQSGEDTTELQLLGKPFSYQENIMDHFYVTLSSDSPVFFSQNIKASFRTKLANAIELLHGKWEGGLVEVY